MSTLSSVPLSYDNIDCCSGAQTLDIGLLNMAHEMLRFTRHLQRWLLSLARDARSDYVGFIEKLAI